jgi:histidine triad (HIT) family protein
MNTCIFCDIVSDKAAAYKVFENKHALAFLDIMPATEGHVLVIPKEHGATLSDISEKSVKETAAVVQKVAKAVEKATDAKGYNILQSNNSVAGQVVFHVHFHIIPRNKGDGLSFSWKRGKLSPEQGTALKEKLHQVL